jgi:hypothetical protein
VDQGHLIARIELPALMRPLRTRQALAAPTRRRGGLVVLPQPAAQRAFAGQGLPRQGFGQHAQEKSCAPVGMTRFQLPSAAENVRSGGAVTRANAAVGSCGNLASMVAALLEQMADGAGRQMETLG